MRRGIILAVALAVLMAGAVAQAVIVGVPWWRDAAAAPAPGPTMPDTNGMYAIWHFEQTNSHWGGASVNSGIYYTNDMYLNPGTAYEPTWYTVAGTTNNAYNFPGAGKHMYTIASGGQFCGFSNMASGMVSCWVYIEGSNSYGCQFIWDLTSAYNQTEVALFWISKGGSYSGTHTNSLDIFSRIDNVVQWDAYTPEMIITTGRWYHIVVTHDGTEPTLWLDAVPQSLTYATSTDKTKWLKAAVVGPTTPADAFVIGHRSYATPASEWYFIGNIDEGFNDTNFSPAQVTNYFQATCPTNKLFWTP